MKYDFTQIPPSWLYCFNISCRLPALLQVTISWKSIVGSDFFNKILRFSIIYIPLRGNC